MTKGPSFGGWGGCDHWYDVLCAFKVPVGQVVVILFHFCGFFFCWVRHNFARVFPLPGSSFPGGQRVVPFLPIIAFQVEPLSPSVQD